VLPSLSAKYPITENFNLKLGYNKAIKRPDLNKIAGPWSIDAADTTVTIPNPDLKPERSQKFSAMLEYYFEPAGFVSVHVFQTEIKNASDVNTGLTAADVGLANDPTYGSYLFTSYINVPGTRRIKGVELSYSQQLTFLPDLLRGTSVFANYARFDSHPRPIQNINGAGWAPQNASGGISYRYRKFNASIAGTWVDESIIANPLTTVLDNGDAQYLKERYVFDLGAGYKLGKHTSLFVSGRNAFNAGKNWYFKRDHRMQQKETYGSQWTVGVTGKY
jgi:TonB-dependent receptor